MNKILIVISCTILLMACQSHKPPMPKGKWVAVNPVGFIPPNTTVYSAKPKENTHIDKSKLKEQALRQDMSVTQPTEAGAKK